MFVVNPNATPFFSVPGQSQNTVGSQGNIELGGGKEVFFKYLSLKGNQDRRLSGTMNPVTDANRLRLMQCAYQRAVGIMEHPCQKCSEIESAWFGDRNQVDGPCNIACGWLRTSKQWRDVPKCCRNRYGSHCGVYVWLDPCQTEEFSRLVLLMIEYATGTKYSKSNPPTTVKFYLNSDASFGSVTHHSTVLETVSVKDGVSNPLLDVLIKSLKENNDKQIEALKKVQSVGKKKGDKRVDIDAIMNQARSGISLDELLKGNDELDSEDNESIKRQLTKLMEERANLEQIKSSTEQPSRPQIDFGPPTQFNSGFGGGILQLRQQLEAGRRLE
jgi:hypothetical protein